MSKTTGHGGVLEPLAILTGFVVLAALSVNVLMSHMAQAGSTTPIGLALIYLVILPAAFLMGVVTFTAFSLRMARLFDKGAMRSMFAISACASVAVLLAASGVAAWNYLDDPVGGFLGAGVATPLGLGLWILGPVCLAVYLVTTSVLLRARAGQRGGQRGPRPS